MPWDAWLKNAKVFDFHGFCFMYHDSKGRVNNYGLFGDADKFTKLMLRGLDVPNFFKDTGPITFRIKDNAYTTTANRWTHLNIKEAKAELQRRLDFGLKLIEPDAFGRRGFV